LWIASLSENDSGTDNMVAKNVSTMEKNFEKEAKSYMGITGNTSLNNVGDRKYGHYDFWALRQSNNQNEGSNDGGGIAWKRVSKYVYNTTAENGIVQAIQNP